MADPRRSIGNEGEDIAGSYLQRLGYVIAARQVRTPFGEIDLVACDGDEVVFVEVKTRRSLASGFPEESVTPKKLAHLAASAEHVLREKRWEGRPFRLDVVSVLLVPGRSPEIEHLKVLDAPRGTW